MFDFLFSVAADTKTQQDTVRYNSAILSYRSVQQESFKVIY